MDPARVDAERHDLARLLLDPLADQRVDRNTPEAAEDQGFRARRLEHRDIDRNTAITDGDVLGTD